MTRHARMRGHAALYPARARSRRHRRPVRARWDPGQGRRESADARPGALPRAHGRLLGVDQAGDARPSSGGSAARSTGDACATRWTRARPRRSASHSTGSTATASRTAPRRSSTGARAARPASATSRPSRRPRRARCGSSVITSSTRRPVSPIPIPSGPITVATTRPETILGDTAVAVHPDDERYRELVGRRVRIPFVDRDVPIIADDVVDRAFGTGAVKITPAHDQDDYETGKRHGLPAPTILADDATVANTGTEFDGLDRYEARRRIVAALAERGDLVDERVHEMVVGRCQRSDDVLEPRLKTQWFIRTEPLAARALEATRAGRTQILPERFVKTWEHWLTNIRDWNVSRQLWWGHRIPAWYCPDGHVTVSAAEAGPDACEVCGRPATRAPAGSRHLRHVVQLGSVAVLDAGVAGRHARLPALLPDLGHGDRLRHHLLLGRPDGDARHPSDRHRAIPHGLPLGADPRSRGREDVEDEGQRRRSARDHGRVRCRCPPIRADPRRRARAGPAVRDRQARERPELRQQALECDPIRRRGAPRVHRRRMPSAACPTTGISVPASAGSCRVPRPPSRPSTARWPTTPSAR